MTEAIKNIKKKSLKKYVILWEKNSSRFVGYSIDIW